LGVKVRTDDGGFDAFVVSRLNALVSYAYLLTGNRHSAEDVVQTALARTAIRWARVHDKANPEGYVRRAIVNEFLNTRRLRRSTEVPVADVTDAVVATAESAYDERDAMWSALATLPRGQRVVLVLRYYEGLSEAEIAAVLGCAAGTVKSQAAKAIAHLRTRSAFREDSTP
jgi:RNA polymerase sigma-70 factor (sigma-E family)